MIVWIIKYKRCYFEKHKLSGRRIDVNNIMMLRDELGGVQCKVSKHG